MAQVEPHESGSVPSDRTSGRPRLEPGHRALRSTRRRTVRRPPRRGDHPGGHPRAGYVVGVRLRPGGRRELDGQHDRLHRRDGVVERGLHGRRRRRRDHRHGRHPGRGPRHRRQGRLRPGPFARVAVARPPQPRHERPRHVHGRHHRRQGWRPRPAICRCARHRVPRDRARRPDRVAQGRRRRRRHGRQPGHRRDRLGRPASRRQRPQHPRPQPVVRDELEPRTTRSTRSPSRSSRRGRPASSSSPPPATTGYVFKTGSLTDPANDPPHPRRRRVELARAR